MSKSTDSPLSRKRKTKSKPVEKPYPNFPLFAHQTGRWAKKIKTKTVYFGKLADGWQPALEKFQREKDDLYAGRVPRPEQPEGITLADLCNHFLTAQRLKMDAAEQNNRTFSDYYRVCQVLVTHFGRNRLVNDLMASDFQGLRSDMAKKLSLVSLGNFIQRVRTVFRFGFDNGHIEKPIRYGSEFKRPSKKHLRLARVAAGEKMLEPVELRILLKVAKQPLKSMLLLALNAALGNTDIGELRLSHIDFDNAMLRFPRVKTGTERRCPLWLATVESLRDWLDVRPEPKDKANFDRVFITKQGNPWVSSRLVEKKGSSYALIDDSVSKETAKLLKDLGMKKPQLGFYSLRHIFRTVADEVRDPRGIDLIMGHSGDGHISSHYIERIDDTRLRAVVEHVHSWIFSAERKETYHA